MATRSHFRSGAALIAGTVLVSFLAGCGSNGLATAPGLRSAAAVEAQEAKVLKKALARIHEGVFARLDGDGNRKIDEYEAGPQLSLADFKKADKNRNHSLTYSEFKNYAITNLFFFKDDKNSFFKRFRSDLGKVFRRLDNNRDLQLVKSEVSSTDLRKLGLTFEYPRLNISVKVQKVTPEAFASADRTQDGKLGEAEFEDLYIEAVVSALSPNAPPPPAPEPAEPDPGAGGDVPPAEDPMLADW